MILDTSHHILSNVDYIEANILIDQDGNAQLADFGLMAIIPDSTLAATTTSPVSSGTLRWMSPELLDPGRFGAKNCQPTKESDCYALGMVILEVLTGKIPFQGSNNLVVMRMVGDGEHPKRPKGPEAAWFTDDLWGTLELCWLYKPKERPTVERVLEYLKKGSATWESLSPSTDGDSQADNDYVQVSTVNSHTRMFFYLVFDLDSPAQSSCSRWNYSTRR